MDARILAVHIDSHSHSLQFRYNLPTSTLGIQNNDQSASLVPKKGFRDYKFPNPGSQNWKSIAITS